MSGFGKSRRIRRRRKGSLTHDAFRMDRTMPRLDSMHLNHGFKDLMREAFFSCRFGAGFLGIRTLGHARRR